MRRERLSLLVIVLLGFALRVYELDAQSFWYDEGVTAQVAQLGIGELARWTADDIQPPLYYLIIGGWLRLTPFGELILRLPSVVFGTLLLPILWALGRRLWHTRAGLVAALVAATSPLLVYYSQEARMYTLLVLLVSLEALLVLHLLDRGKGRRLTLYLFYVLTGIAAMYTHYFAAFALLALVVYWLYVWLGSGRDKRLLGEFLLANALVLLGFAPWLPAMFNRFSVDSSYWAGTLKLAEALIDVGINFTVGATEVMAEADAVRWLPWFGIAAIIWMIAVALGGHRSKQRPLMLLLLWGLLPVIMILALAFSTPKFNARYLMVSWPAWALLAGGGVHLLWAAPVKRRKSLPVVLRGTALLTLALVLVTHILGLTNWYFDDNFAKSGWRSAFTEMYRNRQEDEVALLVSGHAYPIFDTYVPPRYGVERYLLPELDILDVNQVLGWEETADALEMLRESYGGVWLFLWQDEVVDPAGTTTAILDRYAEAQPTGEYSYIDLRHYRFDPQADIPSSPPVENPQLSFGDILLLQGAEVVDDGLWFYWQANQMDMPDLNVALRIKNGEGMVLYEGDQRPVGYDLPTSRWQLDETYPYFIPLEMPAEELRIHLRVYEELSGELLGEQELEVGY